MTVGMSCKSLEIQTLENRWFSYLVEAFLQVILFFRLDKRDVCCRPTAYSRHPLLVFARHPHRCSDRLGVPERARLYSASIQSSSLSSSVSTSWEISCGGDGSVSGRGASLSIGAIGISWTKCVVAGFAACSLPSDIGGNRSRHSGGRKLAIIRLKPFKRH